MSNSSELKGRIALVTGAAGALGRPLAVGLAQRGATVVVAVREPLRAQELAHAVARESGNPDVHPLTLDLASLDSVRRAAQDFISRFGKLHLLVNNAAAYSGERRLSQDGYELMVAVNHLGPFLLTNLLLDTMKKSGGARIINMTMPSKLGLDLEDLAAQKKFDAFEAFQRSKSAGHFLTLELAQRLQGSGVTVHAVNPGMTKTTLIKEAPLPIRLAFKLLAKTPAQNVRPAMKVAVEPEYGQQSGRWVEPSGEKPWAGVALDAAYRQEVWAATAKVVGLA